MPIRLFALFLACALSLSAQGAELVAGRDYTKLAAAQRPDNPGKVEVIEFFSYGCPHCADVHPQLQPWVAKLPADVVFKRVPVGFGRKAWASLARAYYALEATGQLGKLDQALFEAIHKLGLQLDDETTLTAWVGRQGGDARAFAQAYRSFSVVNKATNADRMAMSYQVTQVPTFAVDGRFIAMGDSHERVLANARSLAAQASTQRNASR